jgi:predicted alpha/beta hydrolase family esterase
MYNIVVIHGTFGHPFENWIPWLFKEVKSRNKNVLVPQFPSPDGQNYNNWERILLSYRAFFDEKTVFIGHSLGATFIANFVVKNELKPKKLILISGLYQKIGIPEFDDLNQSFFEEPNLLARLPNQCQDIQAIFGDNDPYLSQKVLNDFADLCGAKKTIITNGGHLNQTAGYLEFPLLLDLIQK